MTDDTPRELCYDSLKELFPEEGFEAILQRSRIWKIISKPVCAFMFFNIFQIFFNALREHKNLCIYLINKRQISMSWICPRRIFHSYKVESIRTRGEVSTIIIKMNNCLYRVRWKRWVAQLGAQLGYLFGYLKSMNIEKQKPYIH